MWVLSPLSRAHLAPFHSETLVQDIRRQPNTIEHFSHFSNPQVRNPQFARLKRARWTLPAPSAARSCKPQRDVCLGVGARQHTANRERHDRAPDRPPVNFRPHPSTGMLHPVPLLRHGACDGRVVREIISMCPWGGGPTNQNNKPT